MLEGYIFITMNNFYKLTPIFVAGLFFLSNNSPSDEAFTLSISVKVVIKTSAIFLIIYILIEQLTIL